MFGRLRLPAVAAALTLCVGCAQRCCHHHAQERISAEFGLPTVERSRIVGEVDLASFATSVESQPAAPVEYRGLTAVECQCLAVENSAIGKLLDRERWSACLSELCGSERRARCLQLAVLRAASQEARNKSGADALRLYYGIAEVEAGLDAVDDSLAEINAATAKIAQIKKQGLPVTFDATEFERRRMTLESKRVDLLATRLKLNTQLRALLGFDAWPNAAFIFPTDPLKATDEPLDAETEVGYGLATRGELQVLGILAGSDAETAAATIRSLLGGMHGLAGLAVQTAANKFLGKIFGSHDPEPCTRHNQVAELYRSRRDQLAGEIRAAVQRIQARRRMAVLAQEQVASWGRRIHELSQRRETGGSTVFELLQAQLLEVEARAAVTTAVIDLKRAEVELRELQGALAAECSGQNVTPTLHVVASPKPTPPVEKIPATPIPQPQREEEQPLPPILPKLLEALPPESLQPVKSPTASLFGPPPLGLHTSYER